MSIEPLFKINNEVGIPHYSCEFLSSGAEQAYGGRRVAKVYAGQSA